MSQIKQIGTYRGEVVEHCLGKTKNEYPRFILDLVACEQYDKDNQQWVKWDDEYGGSEIRAFLVLFGENTKEAIFHAQALQKVFGWSGADFNDLEDADYTGMKLQWRVEENEYNDNVTLQVTRIDTYDADPSGILQRLEKHEIQALNAKYAAGLHKLSGGSKPKSVPKPPTKESKPAPPKKRGRPKKKKDPLEDKTPEEAAEQPEKCTIEEAWDLVCSVRHKSVTDDQLGEIWLEEVEKAGGQDVVEKEGLWAIVRDIVTERVSSKIPF